MITIICIGKLKEIYLKQAQDEYLKRISKFSKLKIIEIEDERIPESAFSKEIENIKDKEGKKILKYLKVNSYVIALAIEGIYLTSEEFSSELEKIQINGISNIIFIIGGSLGLSKEILNAADLKLSFSKMTFPHQIARILLLEQIYRAFKIINNEVYHK